MTYPKEIRAVILERIANDESVASICRDEGMPDKATVFRWLDADPEFATEYARAKEQQADAIVDGFAELESQVLTGEIKPDAAKVVLWSRQWRAEKLKPRVYGTKVDLNHTGQLKIVASTADQAL